MKSDKPLIFISCGQFAEQEKKLGAAICSLVTRLRPDVEPYFAENQSTVEGLSSHILKAMNRAAGLICVMHERGDITHDGRTITRGSVWIEQEIAVAAFMEHALDRSIPVFFYKQVGVGIEGMRSVLLMNARLEFTDETAVIEDLASVLPSAVFSPFNRYDIVPVISNRRLPMRSSPDHNICELVADVKNVGTDRIIDFEIRVLFPRAFLNPSSSWGAEDRTKSTASHICFVANATGRAPTGLYPGDGLRNPMTIEYFVDSTHLQDYGLMNSEILVDLFSGSMKPRHQVKRMSEFWLSQ